jgi:arylsulfatase
LPPKTPEEGYHLSVDLVDKANIFISNHESVAPEKPWLLWLAFGACHAPHHVPKEWINRYKGKFDKGWDKVREEIFQRQKKMAIVPMNTELAPRNEGVQKWDDLSDDEKRLFARYMECYAGFLSHTDEQIGRLISFLEKIGKIENTLIFVCSDNGASAEGMLTGLFNENSFFNAEPETVEQNLKRIDEIGGTKSFNHYPAGWAMAGDTPFKWYKQYTHFGGTKDPLIVHWPKGIRDKGKIRTQFHHSIDIVPTILEAIGVDPPSQIGGYTQAPIEGASMFYSFNDSDSPSTKQVQYFEMLGNRGIWYKGWKAVTFHGRLPWESEAKWSFDEDKWELYNVEEDFSECHDLADKYPEKLRHLVETWWAEAGKYNVLPLDDRLHTRLITRRGETKEQTSYIYYSGAVRIPGGSAPHTQNRSYSITAEVEIPTEGKAQGPICVMGGLGAGWSLYIMDGLLTYCHNCLGELYYVRSEKEVPTGKNVKLRFEFEKTGKERFGAGGVGRMYINGMKVGEDQIPRTVKFMYANYEGFDIGMDTGTPVTDEYKAGARFTGIVERVVIDLSGERHIDPEAESKIALKRQ